MKKTLIVLSSVVAILVLAVLILPLVFKGKIERIVNEKIAATLNAKVSYGAYSLSLLKSFPDLNAHFSDIAVVGKADFEGDTLISLGGLSASINVKSLFKGDGILINSIATDQLLVNLIFTEDEKANWDIFIEPEATPETEAATEPEVDDMLFLLERIDVANFDLIYTDRKGNYTFSMLETSGVVNGDFEGMIATLDIQALSNAVSYVSEGVAYLEKRKVEVATSLIANFETFEFQFEADKSRLNQIPLSVKGGFAMPTDTLVFDIQFEAPELTLKQVLDLVPSAYAHYMKDLQAKGDVTLNGSLTGIMTDEIYPAMAFNFEIVNGEIKHPQLPEVLQIEKLDASLSKAQGSLDLFEFGLHRFDMVLANNPLSMKARFASLMTDPEMDVQIKGVLDFEALTKIVPIDSVVLTGMLRADAKVQGRYSDVENNRFDRFTSAGQFDLSNFKLVNSSFPEGISLSKASLTLKNQSIAVSDLKGQLGKTDFALNGSLDQVIAWFMDKGELKGRFQLNSKLLDLNQFLNQEPSQPVAEAPKQTTEPAQKPATQSEPLELPKNMHLTFNASVQKLVYSTMNITNFNGGIVLKDQVLTLTGLKMNVFGGELGMTGSVIADGRKEPDVNLALKIRDFNLPETYKDVSLMQKYMPFAAKSKGQMSSTLNLKTKISTDLKMILETLTANGTLSMNDLVLVNTSGLDNLKSLVKIDELKNIDVKDFDTAFGIVNGNLEVKPFKTELAKQPVSIGGTANLSGTLKFRIDGKLETKLLASNIQNILTAIPGGQRITTIDLGFDLLGDIQKPQVKFDNDLIKRQAMNQLKSTTPKELEDAAKNLLKKLTK